MKYFMKVLNVMCCEWSVWSRSTFLGHLSTSVAGGTPYSEPETLRNPPNPPNLHLIHPTLPHSSGSRHLRSPTGRGTGEWEGMIREPVVTGTTSVTRILTASRHFCCPLLPRVTRSSVPSLSTASLCRFPSSFVCSLGPFVPHPPAFGLRNHLRSYGPRCPRSPFLCHFGWTLLPVTFGSKVICFQVYDVVTRGRVSDGRNGKRAASPHHPSSLPLLGSLPFTLCLTPPHAVGVSLGSYLTSSLLHRAPKGPPFIPLTLFGPVLSPSSFFLQSSRHERV